MTSPSPSSPKMTPEMDLTRFSGFTAGPWLMEADIGVIYDAAGRKPISTGGVGCSEEVQANAKLIAAAPDLLSEVLRLRGALAEAQKDSKRIDWLERNGLRDFTLVTLGSAEECAIVQAFDASTTRGFTREPLNVSRPTLRESLDVAQTARQSGVLGIEVSLPVSEESEK